MTIIKKLSRVGNSFSVLLSKEVRKSLGIENYYKMTVLDNKIIIEKVEEKEVC